MDDWDEDHHSDTMDGYHQFCLEQGYSPFEDDPYLEAAYFGDYLTGSYDYGTDRFRSDEEDIDDWATYSDDWDTHSEILGGDDMPFEKQTLGKYVGLDCELTNSANEKGQTTAIAKVSVVNWHGHCLHDEFIKPEKNDIDIRKFMAGWQPSLINDTSSFDTVRLKIEECIKGRVLVGFNLCEKLKALEIVHDEQNIRDVALWQPYLDKSAPSLPLLQDWPLTSSTSIWKILTIRAIPLNAHALRWLCIARSTENGAKRLKDGRVYALSIEIHCVHCSLKTVCAPLS